VFEKAERTLLWNSISLFRGTEGTCFQFQILRLVYIFASKSSSAYCSWNFLSAGKYPWMYISRTGLIALVFIACKAEKEHLFRFLASWATLRSAQNSPQHPGQREVSKGISAGVCNTWSLVVRQTHSWVSVSPWLLFGTSLPVRFMSRLTLCCAWRCF